MERASLDYSCHSEANQGHTVQVTQRVRREFEMPQEVNLTRKVISNERREKRSYDESPREYCVSRRPNTARERRIYQRKSKVVNEPKPTPVMKTNSIRFIA